ncbi:chaperonin Cpn10 [Striga asiatica]|uniref:Chaperonin Cpn10 n=1 Tax=Striga asiatica TaxID=4170 RepID=A0A5A7NZ74_STRAF|nr:chaperonin Cpn10 [Striga asiatica]
MEESEQVVVFQSPSDMSPSDFMGVGESNVSENLELSDLARVSLDVLGRPKEPTRRCSGGLWLPACMQAKRQLSVARVGLFGKVQDCGFLDGAQFRLAVTRSALYGNSRVSDGAMFKQERSPVVCGSAGKDRCGWSDGNRENSRRRR